MNRSDIAFGASCLESGPFLDASSFANLQIMCLDPSIGIRATHEDLRMKRPSHDDSRRGRLPFAPMDSTRLALNKRLDDYVDRGTNLTSDR
jgi:hypothetical protein